MILIAIEVSQRFLKILHDLYNSVMPLQCRKKLTPFETELYYFTMITKSPNQKEIPTPKTEVKKKTKLTLKTYRKPSEQLFPNRRPGKLCVPA